MQLCHQSQIPTAEFAALTLLMEPDHDTPGLMGTSESLMVVSPLAITQLSDAAALILELHEYLNSTQNSFTLNTEKDSSTNENGESYHPSITRTPSKIGVIEKSQREAGSPQIFRSSRGNGKALHFLVSQDPTVVKKCSSVVLLSGKGGGRTAGNDASPQSVEGVVVVVGISGMLYSQPLSALIHAMNQHMLQFLNLIRRMDSFPDAAECRTCVKALLSTLFLTDDEERKTNAMLEAEAVTLSSEATELDSPIEKLKSTSLKPKRGPTRRNQLKRGTSGAFDLSFSLEADSSADMARRSAEKVAVLSVAEKDAGLTQYASTGQQRKLELESVLGKSRVRSRRRKAGDETILEDFDCPHSPETARSSAPMLKSLGRQRNTEPPLSVNGTFTKNPTKPGVPTLSAPRNDVARITNSRKGNIQSSARSWTLGSSTSSQPVRHSSSAFENNFPSPATVQEPISKRESAFDVFAVGSGDANSFDAKETFASVSLQTVDIPEGGQRLFQDGFGFGGFGQTSSLRVREPQAVGNQEFDPFTTATRVDRSDETAPTFISSPPVATPSTNASDSSRQRMPRDDKRLPTGDRGISQSDVFHSSYNEDLGERDEFGISVGREWTSPMASEFLRHQNGLDKLAEATSSKVFVPESGRHEVSLEHPQLTVSIALNEDLTCSYKQSKMSSCTIEGVVQVQVSSDTDNGVPFFLFVRDPSHHISTMQENRRYADDITQAMVEHDEVERGADYKFTVSVPKSQSYFPIMRYKCGNELRPVPIRVQTRVRLNATVCRVALQISSNPANEDDLTDLTIVMGVPPSVKGETLTTSPAGGVWNPSKRSVVWCVAELGAGEKFQLQAQFQMNPETLTGTEADKPKFPVLVRCQCMYSQLSNVELEVSDIPEIFPASVSMKLARRFRLSHRERS